MTRRASDLAPHYAVALEMHLSRPSEATLHRAYELGRKALDDGLGVLDIAMLHHAALAAGLAAQTAGEQHARMSRAAEFLAECLSPFEMTLLGYQEANARLAGMNATLERLNAEAREANERLTAEMADRHRAEEALQQTQKLQAVGRLAAGVAHHFNNLLTVMLGNIDLAQQNSDREVRDHLLAAAVRAGQRGAGLTRQLLSFSRQQLLNPEIVQPSGQLGNIAALLGGSLRGDIVVETDIPMDLWSVELDPAELELALLNLGINARDAMPGGGVLRIAAANRTIRDSRSKLDGDFLVIEVSDNGTGIPPEVLPRVFEPFFTTKEIGAGSGLGLSHVHGFAHQAGGVVAIESELGKGTTVRLYLPAARDSATGAPAAETSPQERGGLGTILVVEDDVEVADLAAGVLTEYGFKVKLAYRAQIALELLRRGEPVDLVFSDIRMPDGMNGIELAEEVKSRFPTIPVLLATGYSDALADATAKGLRIIAKPYRNKELCSSVSRLLAPHKD